SVAVDNTNPRRADRAALIRQARERGATVTGYYFPTSAAEALQRNKAREGRARVPAVAIFTAAKRLGPPALAQGSSRLFTVALLTPDEFAVTPTPRSAGA